MHTPGPWEWDFDNENMGLHTGLTGDINGSGEGVLYPRLETVIQNGHVTAYIDSDNEDNFGLIAAAPDMKKALQSVLASVPFADFRGDGELEECEKMVRAAIAKANRRLTQP